MPEHVVVSGALDDIRPRDVRLLEEAAKAGPLAVLLWSDAVVHAVTGRAPKFPERERRYFVGAVRHVSRVEIVTELPGGPDVLPDAAGPAPHTWVLTEAEASPARRAFCRSRGIACRVVPEAVLRQFPENPEPNPALATQRRVVVTGCYDWFHSGHVRFFEEVSAHGSLFVVVGNDANVRKLKGEGHPLVSERERRYIAGSIRHVTQALVSSGTGWLDAEPEIARLRPDIYAVNEDGDRGGKREFCADRGIEYLVLKRTPAPGLARRSSTDLRGF